MRASTRNHLRIAIGLIGLLIASAAGLTGELRVTHADAMRNALKKPAPDYNPIARQMKIQGEVEVEVNITEAGEVTGVKPITGNPMLTVTVVRTVKGWKFTPFTEDGKAVPALARMKFSFKL